MTRGLGKLQQRVKQMIQVAESYGVVSVPFASVRKAEIMRIGGELGRDKLRPAAERSLSRALKTLVDRGEVVIDKGSGRPGDPYHYRSVEAVASAFQGRTITDTKEAKRILEYSSRYYRSSAFA